MIALTQEQHVCLSKERAILRWLNHDIKRKNMSVAKMEFLGCLKLVVVQSIRGIVR